MLPRLSVNSSPRAFTLIELLVVIAIIGIVVVVVVIAINPVQRIADAQLATLKAQVAAVGSAYDICTSYVDTSVVQAVQNAISDCNSLTLLSTGTTKGAPFLKTRPTGTFTFQPAGVTNLFGCLFSSVVISGTPTYAQFLSSNNTVATSTMLPACP